MSQLHPNDEFALVLANEIDEIDTAYTTKVYIVAKTLYHVINKERARKRLLNHERSMTTAAEYFGEVFREIHRTSKIAGIMAKRKPSNP